MKTAFITILLLFGYFLQLPTVSASVQNDVCLNKDEIPKNKPYNNGQPVDVSISFYVADIEEINDVEQSYIIDVFVSTQWFDKRLKHKNTSEKISCQYNINDIWAPRLTILNLREANMELREIVAVSSDGKARFLQRVHGKLSIPMNLKLFPFDKQKVPIKIMSLQYTKEEVTLAYENDHIGTANKYSVPNWIIDNLSAVSGEYVAQSLTHKTPIAVLPMIEFSLEAKRHLHYYLWKVVVPTLFIVLMSWALFWIKPIRIETRAGLAATTILTLIAFLFSLSNILPQVSYLTIMDIWVLICIIYVFAAFVETIISSTIALNGDEQRAEKMQRIARYLFPIIYIIVLISFIVVMFTLR